MTMAFLGLLFFFCFVMTVAGLALFFGSDYAQARWGSGHEPTSAGDVTTLLVVSDYRVRERVR